MTHIALLDCLKDFSEEITKDLLLPEKTSGTAPSKLRPPAVYQMSLPDSHAATNKVPYIIHQAMLSEDVQHPGEIERGDATIRTIFCVYNRDEQEGRLALLNLIERHRIGLLKKVVLGNQFQLDLDAGLKWIVYPDDTAPYYAGEMTTIWKMPPIQREVDI